MSTGCSAKEKSVLRRRDLKERGARVRRVLNEGGKEELVRRVAIVSRMVRTKPRRRDGLMSW